MQYRTIDVSASRCYNIHIGRDLLAGIGELVRPLLGNCRLAVLTDSNVDVLYGGVMMQYLASAGYDACKYVIPAGEASKCADNLLAFLNFLAREQITRSDAERPPRSPTTPPPKAITASLRVICSRARKLRNAKRLSAHFEASPAGITYLQASYPADARCCIIALP